MAGGIRENQHPIESELAKRMRREGKVDQNFCTGPRRQHAKLDRISSRPASIRALLVEEKKILFNALLVHIGCACGLRSEVHEHFQPPTNRFGTGRESVKRRVKNDTGLHLLTDPPKENRPAVVLCLVGVGK